MDDNILVGAVERPAKTWVRVAERLQSLILTKKLAPGDQLPPERVLCQKFGVSRTVLREAIKHLSAQGLVEEMMGRGTFVSKPNLDAVRKSLQICLGWHAQAVFENLVELRRLIEADAAALASINATEDELAALRANIRTMEEEAEGDVEKFTQVDLEFHAGLAKATHNDLFVMLFEAISSALVETWAKLHQDRDERRRGVRNHQRILAAVERRRPEEARQAVRDNIESFKEEVVGQAKSL